MGFSTEDTQYMAEAIRLAKRGHYTTRPNPRVGCVLVKDQQVIARGWHYRAGESHAEVQALNALENPSDAQGATAYVTLEPCSHQGRTGACAQAFIDVGIAKVVYGMVDPNPLVAGRGLDMMSQAGIEVDGPLLEAEAQLLNPGFIQRMRDARPWVRAKVATSMDGRTAMASGESQWITGAPARKDVQKLRAQSCAVITGIGSIEQDNSRLNLRRDELLLNNVDDVLALPPLRVVLDSQLRIKPDAAIFNSPGQVLVFCSHEVESQKREALQQAHPDKLVIQPVACASGVDDKAGLDLNAVLSHLVEQYQCNEILVEAGARLIGGFLQAQLIDELVIYQAPILMGSQARGLAALPFETMSEKLQLQVNERRMVGDDCRISASIDYSSHPSQN